MHALSPRKSRRVASRVASRIASVIAASAVLGIATACSSDSVTAPAPQVTASNNAFTDLVQQTLQQLVAALGLKRTIPLQLPVVRAQLIGPKGGTIDIKETGLKVTVPSGAITGAPILITVTAVPGTMVAYDFQPHGTKFAKPLQFEQELKGTNWDKLKLKMTLQGGYFKSLSQLDPLRNTAQLDETYPVTLTNSRLSFDIWHFSGYMVSTGRADDTSAPELF